MPHQLLFEVAAVADERVVLKPGERFLDGHRIVGAKPRQESGWIRGEGEAFVSGDATAGFRYGHEQIGLGEGAVLSR